MCVCVCLCVWVCRVIELAENTAKRLREQDGRNNRQELEQRGEEDSRRCDPTRPRQVEQECGCHTRRTQEVTSHVKIVQPRTEGD
jgi:hypothetical protein